MEVDPVYGENPLSYSRRFWGLLSVAAVKGITQSIEGFVEADESGAFRVKPTMEEVLAGAEDVPDVSRLA